MKKIIVEIIAGVEGPSLYMNDYRVAGPKPWGGGKLIHKFTVERKDIEKVLAEKEDGENEAS